MPQLPVDRRFSYRFNMIGRALAQHAASGGEFESGRISNSVHTGRPQIPSIKDIAANPARQRM
jgi:hypothetical protein